jgi:hypothetical protein
MISARHRSCRMAALVSLNFRPLADLVGGLDERAPFTRPCGDRGGMVNAPSSCAHILPTLDHETE